MMTVWTPEYVQALLHSGWARRSSVAAHGWSVYDPETEDWYNVVQEHAEMLDRAAGS